jgi:two-component system chemotaxis sensor kinase CheA
MSTDPIFDIFRDEAHEHFAALEQGFLDLEAATSPDARRPIVDELFRHAHSLKGDARSLGFEAMEQSAQQLENTLDSLRQETGRADQATIDRALRELDAVRQAFEDSPVGEAGAQPETEADDLSIDEQPDKKPEEGFTIRVPSEHLDRMLTLTAELRISHRGDEDLTLRLADLREQLHQGPIADLRALIGHETSVEDYRSHIDGLLDAHSSLVDQVDRIRRNVRRRHVHEELLLESLETDIRKARLLPLSLVTDPLRRTVRELARSLHKSIRYEADVSGILLDKAVIESLKDPLLHMIRNAAGHGIESPQERRQTGKPEEGAIRIAALCCGDQVRITVSDDGRGVDFERIRQRLRQQRVLNDEELADLTHKDLGAYLFQPGFTTTETEDTVSGRGVGLDVVFEVVRRMHGNVELVPTEEAENRRSPTAKRKSVGTTFAITVPVTVSTVRILTVLASGQWYGIPSAVVVRTGQVRNEQLQELERTTVLPLDGEPVRWVHLADLLETDGPARGGEQDLWRYLLLEWEGKRLAVAVDDLEDELEVVLKPLGFPLRGLPGVMGATIRPDGTVQIVLDPAGLPLRRGRFVAKEQERTTKRGRVLVVDDSPTTRAILRKVLAAAGYTVHVATDGNDALGRLRTHRVDLVVSDVVMPRMDGFQLTHEVKAKYGLPVVLVTSMESEEHRRRGLEAGADAYVVKSTFEEKGLLEIVKQLV